MNVSLVPPWLPMEISSVAAAADTVGSSNGTNADAIKAVLGATRSIDTRNVMFNSIIFMLCIAGNCVEAILTLFAHPSPWVYIKRSWSLVLFLALDVFMLVVSLLDMLYQNSDVTINVSFEAHMRLGLVSRLAGRSAASRVASQRC